MMHASIPHQPTGRPFCTLLPAAAWQVADWTALSLALESAEPDTPPEQPQQPSTEASTQPTTPLLSNSLRLGDYIVGDVNCPVLYGHPDIRY